MEELNIKTTLSTENTLNTNMSIGKGETGATGQKGDPFTYNDFTPEQLEALKPKKGIDYFDGSQGIQGIQGVQGEKGNPFTYADFTPEQLNALKPIKGVDYQDGKDGTNGKDGYTPIKGVDYRDGIDGINGRDGYTPIKGIDYRDGIDGKDGINGTNGTNGCTPIKGVDYFDGRNGIDGINGTNGKDGVSFDINTTYPTLATTDKTLIGAMNEVFQNVDSGKTLIASAISTKGITTSKDDTFQTMATNIGKISGGGEVIPENPPNVTWTKPADWPDLAQFDNDGQTLVAFLVRTDYPVDIGINTNALSTANLDVDWGTGTWEIGVSSNTLNARRTITGGIPTSGGYNVAIIRVRRNSSYPTNYISSIYYKYNGVTATTTGELWVHIPNPIKPLNYNRSFSTLTCSPSAIALYFERISGYLKDSGLTAPSGNITLTVKSIYSYDDLLLNTAQGICNANNVKDIVALNSVVLSFGYNMQGFYNIPNNLVLPSGTGSGASMFTNFKGYKLNLDLSACNFTNVSRMFMYSTDLQVLPKFNTSNATDVSYLFYGCVKLKSVPNLDISNATTTMNMFQGCMSLESVPALNTSKSTDMTSMYQGCSALTSIPDFDSSSAINMSAIFSGCSNLKAVPNFTTVKATSITSMFNGCSSLTNIPNMNTSLVTSMGSTFNNCSGLKYLPTLDYSKVTNMASFVNGCTSLVEIDISTATSLGTNVPAFSNLYSLKSLKLPANWNQTLNVAGTNLSATELNRIFTELPTVTGKTITITGSLGASTCDKTIATAKGWTVTG